jgi:hypothetical protein
MRYLLAMDPDGCWVALDGKDVIGFAISQNRGALWYLATYGVLPEHQGMGVGRQLMDAVLAHAEARAGIFSSSVHPGATRRYRLAGFSLHPQMRMVGVDGPAGSRSAGGGGRPWPRPDVAASEGETLVNCITTANQWAVDVGLGAGLDIGQEGYIALRGLPEPTPYLPSGHFL